LIGPVSATALRRAFACQQPLRPALCPVVLVAVLRILALPNIALGQDVVASPQTTFFRANALYKDGQYAAAAQEYEQVLQSGVHSGPLYFNLGNAYFKAGDPGRAILNYERAARYLPRDPDLLANLSYAQSLSGTTTCPAPLWRRLGFPLAARMSTLQLALLVTGLYTLLFLGLAAHRLWPQRPRWLLYLTVGLAIGLLESGSSLAYQIFTNRQPAAVVVRTGDTPVRFEPADSGTVHFVLKEGSLLRVLDQRDGWLQVSRCDGRRGWIERASVETL